MEEAPSYKGDWTRQIAVCSGALAQHMAAACFSWLSLSYMAGCLTALVGCSLMRHYPHW